MADNTPPVQPSSSARRRSYSVKILKSLIPLIVILAIFTLIDIVYVSGWSEMKFFTPGNITQVIGQTVVIAIGAVGMTFIIVSAGIDLSVGSLVALAGVMSTWTVMAVLNGDQSNIAVAMSAGLAAGILTGAFAGFLNGSMINLGKLPPFIVTLGMMEIIRGAALQWADGVPISGIPNAYKALSNSGFRIDLGSEIISIPYSLFVLIIVGLAGSFVLRKTVFGMQVYAVGSNENTARLCGVNVERVKLFVYMIGGLTAGIAGMLHASRLNSGQPSEAIGMELEVIAAVVIGGGSLMGGEGTVLGAIIGAFIIKFLYNGCNLIGVSSYMQRIVIGLIIIIAVYVDQMRRKTASAKQT